VLFLPKPNAGDGHLIAENTYFLTGAKLAGKKVNAGIFFSDGWPSAGKIFKG